MSKELTPLEIFNAMIDDKWLVPFQKRVNLDAGIDIIRTALTELEQLREEVKKLRKIAKRYDLMTMGLVESGVNEMSKELQAFEKIGFTDGKAHFRNFNDMLKELGE